MSFDKSFQAVTRQLHVSVLVRLARGGLALLELDQLVSKISALVLAGNVEPDNSVTDAKRALVRQFLCANRFFVERARHNPKRTQAAFRRPIAKLIVHRQQLEKICVAQIFHDLRIKLRTFVDEAVRTVGFELVRQIAARHEKYFPPEFIGDLRNYSPELVMNRRRKARQPDSQKFHAVEVEPRLLQKSKRDHRAVVERRISFAECSRRHAPIHRVRRKFSHEVRVVIYRQGDLRRAELSHVARGGLARRDMEVIRVHYRVRARDDYRVGLELDDSSRDFFVSVCRRRNFFFLAASDFRQNYRRMRHRHCAQDTHGQSSSKFFQPRL